MAKASREERGSTWWWVGLFGVALVLLASAGPAESTPQSPSLPSPTLSRALPDGFFADWPAGQKPYLVLVLSGQQHSYLKFCGCTERQLGGFERRYNFISKLREKGWPVVSLDLGDLVMQQASTQFEQSLLKFDTEMKALAALDYSGIALGEHDFKLDLLKALANNVFQNAANFPPLLCGNLADRALNFPGANGSVIENAVVRGGKNGVPRVGIVGVAGPSVMKEGVALNLKFETENTPQGPRPSAKPAIKAALELFAKEKVDFRVLLFQGDIEYAKFIAGAPNIANQVDKEFADKFDAILCLSAQEEPPGRPEIVGKTMIVCVGHRGRHIGVVGVFGKPGAFDKHYQFVEMSEDYETDAGKEPANPILNILEAYAKDVKNQGFVKKTPQLVHPVQAQLPSEAVGFIGSDKCKTCHLQEYTIWEREIIGSKKKHSHAKAFEALEKYAKKPKLRQFDPECVVCHTVGYGFKTGYDGDANKSHLKNVGCENCHGPGNPHAAQPNNPAFHRWLSPWKSAKNDLLPTPERMQLGYNALTDAEKKINNNVNDLCQKCHDTDNDPTFKFEKFWPRIRHGRKSEPVDPAKLAKPAAP